MDIVPSIWLSSFAGAAFFYAGGRIWPRVLRPAPDAGAGAPQQSFDLEASRAAIAYAEAEAAAAGEARAEAARALEEERARAASLEEQIAVVRTASAQAEARLADEKAKLADEKARIGAQAAEVAAQLADLRARGTAEQGKTKARVSAAEARAAEAEKKAAGSTAALKAKLEETTREISRARVEAAVESRRRETSLADEMDRGKRELVAANARVKELGARLAAAEARAADADRLRDENAGLRQAVATLEQGRAAEVRDAEELRRRVRELEAQSFAREAMESVPELPPSERWEAGGDEPLQRSLETALAEVVEHEAGCRTAVLSDTRGLLIAAAGGEASREEIAAAAALAIMAADRLQDLLPVGRPTSMAVLDDNRVVFRTRWLRHGDECFLLSTLGVRTRPLEQGADTLRARLTALVFG